MDRVVFWAGVSIALLGAFLVVVIAWVSSKRAQDRTLDRVRTAPLRSVGDAHGGLVKLRGHVVGLDPDDEPIVEPLSGRHCVWYRIEASAMAATGGTASPNRVPVHQERAARRYAVDDGSGSIEIDVDDAGYLVPLVVHGGVASPTDLPWERVDLTPQDAAIVRERAGRGDSSRVDRIEVWALPEGSEVTVVGWVSDGPHGRRVGADLDGFRPIVLGVDEDVVADDRRERTRNRRVVATVGAAMLAGGVLLAAVADSFA